MYAALSFCVDRLREIDSFVPQKYWKVQVEAKLLDGKSYPLSWKVPASDAVEDTRNKSQGKESNAESSTYNRESANRVVEQASHSEIHVLALEKSPQTISPPCVTILLCP